MQTTAKEAVERLMERMKSVIDQVSEEAGKRESLQAQVREIRDHIERYSKQMPLLSRTGGGGERDSEYGGFWPNEERAAQFGRTVLASAHPNGDMRRACAEALGNSDLTLRTSKGQFVKSEDYVKAMGEGVGTTGGYLVADELMKTVIRYVEQFGVTRKRLTKVPMSS
ncbi:MAG: phage major capsid protein, partial [Phycisphaerae bacterium]|nr:phage major capsid protein [Phycisphaerae bacterium]